jgi:hypothetical protein
VSFLPHGARAMLAGLPKHHRCMSLRTGASRIADASELGIEIVLGHATHLEQA